MKRYRRQPAGYRPARRPTAAPYAQFEYIGQAPVAISAIFNDIRTHVEQVALWDLWNTGAVFRHPFSYQDADGTYTPINWE